MLLLAAALPLIYWDQAPKTAPLLQEAGIAHIAVPAGRQAAWAKVDGVSAEGLDLRQTVKLALLAVQYVDDPGDPVRPIPLIYANGGRLVRQPNGRFWYDVAGAQAPIAAAEAFFYGVAAPVRPDADGLKPLAEMLRFLKALPETDLPALADIGLIDDGSPAINDALNYLLRSNLLVKPVANSCPDCKVTVRIGSPDYPAKLAGDPGALARLIRSHLTDQQRSIRVYGSNVVVARLFGGGDRLQVRLLNYRGAARPILGLRIRVLGRYENHKVHADKNPNLQLRDFAPSADSTEFTVPFLNTLAVIELSR